MENRLTSKVSLIQIGMLLLFTVVFFGALSVFLTFEVVQDLQKGKPLFKTLFFLPAFLISFVGYSIYYLLTRFPGITIDRLGITVSTVFKTKTYLWSEIEEIELTGKQFHSFLFVSMPVEATTFKLKNNSLYILWADFYRNISDLRVILERANQLLKSNSSFSSLDFAINKKQPTETEIGFTAGEEYNGNHLFTLKGALFYFVLSVVVYLVLQNPTIFDNPKWLVLLLLPVWLLFVLGVLSYTFHYFILTDRFLIVKHSIWFWRKHVYLLDDIREVVFEMPQKLPISMRIITRDFKAKLYPSENLSNKTWKLLKSKIELKGVAIRDEVPD